MGPHPRDAAKGARLQSPGDAAGGVLRKVLGSLSSAPLKGDIHTGIDIGVDMDTEEHMAVSVNLVLFSKGVQCSFQGVWGGYKAGFKLIRKELCSYLRKCWVLFVGVFTSKAILFGVHITAPDFWKLPTKK